MEPRLSLVTLAVADMAASRRFYEEGLGWAPRFHNGDVAFYPLNGVVLGLYARRALAADLGVAAETLGVGASALAHNVRSRDEVDTLMAEAVRAGATVAAAPREAEWGGYAGYFRDPDGHLWEVAWNPDWAIGPDGSVRMPE